MKSAPLKALVNWLEQIHNAGGPSDSLFETPVSSVFVMKTEAALTWALATGLPVTVYTGDIAAPGVLACLALRRAHLGVEDFFQGNLEDDDFERLTRCLAEIRRSGLELEEGPPPVSAKGAAFLGGPLFAVVNP